MARFGRGTLSVGDWAAVCVLAVTMATASGCFGTTHIYYAGNSRRMDKSLTTSVTVNNWFWGLSSPESALINGHLNVAAYCGSTGFATMDVEHTIGDYLGYVFTLGIWAPTTVHLTCQ